MTWPSPWTNQLISLLIIVSPAGEFTGMFFYSPTPGPGNLIFSISGSGGADPFSNFYPAGFVAGTDQEVQMVLAENSGTGILEWFFQNVGFQNASMVGQQVGPFARILLTGPAALYLNHTDFISNQWNTSDGTSSANSSWVYTDIGGTAHFYLFMSCQGIQLPAVNNIQAVTPGTGTVTTPATPETWHQITSFSNSWAASGGRINGAYYRKLPWGDGTAEVILELVNPTVTGNSVAFNLPVGYRPSVQQNHPCGWDNPVASNSASAPWLFVDTTGDVSVIAYEATGHDIFAHIFVPLTLVN